jgi:hypothetical protein
MRVAVSAVLMLSLMVITEVVTGKPSLFIMSLCSLRVGPFVVEGAVVVGWGGAAAGADLANGGLLFFLGFFATCAHEGVAGWVVLVLGGGGGGGGKFFFFFLFYSYCIQS